MRRLLAVVPLFLVLVLVAPAAPAQACSCAGLGTAQKVAGADVIVRGTITGSEDPGGGNSGRLVNYDVAVAQVYKGTVTATASVRSPADGGSCGIEVRQGTEYLIFARRVGSELRAELCGGTAPASGTLVADVERITGPGTPQRVTASPTPASSASERSSATLPVGLGLGGALLASAGGVLWWRRRVAAAARRA